MTPREQYVAGVEHSAQILEAAGYDVVPLLLIADDPLKTGSPHAD